MTAEVKCQISMDKHNEDLVLKQTKIWVQNFVIGENLCPFAARPSQAGTIKYRTYMGNRWEELLNQLIQELLYLKETPSDITETTLLIHPNVLIDFEDYLAFLERGEEVIEKMELEGVLQLASFHPDYQFEGVATDAASNYTNRSPFPMLHIIREDSVERAVEQHPDAEGIPDRNIAHLESIGQSNLKERLDAIKRTN